MLKVFPHLMSVSLYKLITLDPGELI